MDERPIWFAPKRYGCGSGLPVTWQGWLVTALYLALVTGASVAFDGKPLLLMSIVAPATILFLIICVRTTAGGWCWRWGRDD